MQPQIWSHYAKSLSLVGSGKKVMRHFSELFASNADSARKATAFLYEPTLVNWQHKHSLHKFDSTTQSDRVGFTPSWQPVLAPNP